MQTLSVWKSLKFVICNGLKSQEADVYMFIGHHDGTQLHYKDQGVERVGVAFVKEAKV